MPLSARLQQIAVQDTSLKMGVQLSRLNLPAVPRHPASQMNRDFFGSTSSGIGSLADRAIVRDIDIQTRLEDLQDVTLFTSYRADVAQ